MFTEPDSIVASSLAQTIADGWGLDVTSLEYLPVGFGSHHWLARRDGNDERWFVTVDDLDAKRRDAGEPLWAVHLRLRAALATARTVRDRGLDFVVAPLATVNGDVVARITDRFTVAVYPYIEGTHGTWRDFASRQERLAVLDLLVDLHDCPLQAVTDAAVEDWNIPRRVDLIDAVDDLGGAWDSGPYGVPARDLLARHVDAVRRLLDHHDRLAGAQRRRPERMVLTHGEPHIGNTIVADGCWLLVDWDTTLIAPPERDLWTVAGADLGVLEVYTGRTGRQLLPDALECYRLAWDLAEIALYIALFREEHDDSADVRESWNNLSHYLDPPRRWQTLT